MSNTPLIGNCHFNKIFEVKNFLSDEQTAVVLKCLQNKDVALHYPDEAQARTREEVDNALITAHTTVDILIQIIKESRETMCHLCRQNAQMKADHSWILGDKPETPCSKCPWREDVLSTNCITNESFEGDLLWMN